MINTTGRNCSNAACSAMALQCHWMPVHDTTHCMSMNEILKSLKIYWNILLRVSLIAEVAEKTTCLKFRASSIFWSCLDYKHWLQLVSCKAYIVTICKQKSLSNVWQLESRKQLKLITITMSYHWRIVINLQCFDFLAAIMANWQWHNEGFIISWWSCRPVALAIFPDVIRSPLLLISSLIRLLAYGPYGDTGSRKW